MPGRGNRWSRLLLVAAALALFAACGSWDSDTGRLCVQLVWPCPGQSSNTSGLRANGEGLLGCFVDQVRVTVKRSGKQVAVENCPYGEFKCVLSEIPAGGGYQVVADALAGEDLAFQGTATDQTVRKDRLTSVSIPMAQVGPDSYSPAAVTDLSGSIDVDEHVVLTWTASGDDCLLGKPEKYNMWYSRTPLSEGTLGDPNLDGPTNPKTYPEGEVLRLNPMLPGTYYFALKVEDDALNNSALSNVVQIDVQ
jgi:hypothetical protein